MSDETLKPGTGEEKPTETATDATGAGKSTSDAPVASLPPQSANTGVGQNDPGATERVPSGYGKPPIEHRFKPGQCANPGGRPRGLSLTGTFRMFADKGMSNEELLAIVGGKDKRYKKPVHRMAARHLLDSIVKGKLVDLAYERIDGKVPQATVEISLTPAQAQAMTDDEIRDLLRR